MSTRVRQEIEPILERMTETSARRDQVLADSRQLVRRAANAIRASHRSDWVEAERELGQATEFATQFGELASTHPAIYWAGYVQDALKEFVEATIVLSVLRGGAIAGPTELRVEDAAWLNGLAEAGSELRRDVLDQMRSGESERAITLLETMDEIYSMLVLIDFPDALTGGLRRTTDSFRAVLERTRGDVTISLGQNRLDASIQKLLRQLGEEQGSGAERASHSSPD